MSRFDYITKTATETGRCWTNKERVHFHLFNPNGLLKTKLVADDLISAAVEEGKAKSGAILAYGALNCFASDRLYEMSSKKYIDRIELSTILDMIKSDIAAAKNFLATI